MKRWITKDIIALVKRTIADPTVVVKPIEAGGDVDGQGVSISLPGDDDDGLTIRPFRADGKYYGREDGDRSNIDAEMLELQSLNSDSDGGVQTRNEQLAIAGTRLRIALQNEGWQVVPTLRPYF
jgi:hypothetical protein